MTRGQSLLQWAVGGVSEECGTKLAERLWGWGPLWINVPVSEGYLILGSKPVPHSLN